MWVLYVYIIKAHHPVVDNDVGANPFVLCIEEEHHAPVVFAVEEFLASHFGIEFALEQQQILD